MSATAQHPGDSSRSSPLYLEVALVSLAALLLEVSYTRIFSFKVSSYFTYLIIGFSLLGIGSGGTLVALLSRGRRRPAALVLPRLALGTALVTVAGYLVIAFISFSSFSPPTDPRQLASLASVCFMLYVSFAGVGLILSWVFSHHADDIARLYFADLSGAALGCALAVPLMVWIAPPGCVMAAGAVFAIAGVRVSRSARWRWAGIVTATVAAVLAINSNLLPDPRVDPAKTLGEEKFQTGARRLRESIWHPVFRVDVFEFTDQPTAQLRALAHDGLWGSSIWQSDGDFRSQRTRLEATNRGLVFGVAPAEPRVLVIGSAGGQEIQASLAYDAREVVGVELNPVTVGLLRGPYRRYTGNFLDDPRVTLINAEGRSFLQRETSTFDLIYFVAPDSYAAMNAAQASGFVLAESYLYTVEMIQQAMAHLTPGGVLAMQFGEFDYEGRPNRTARYAVSARAALAELDIGDFPKHILVATNRDLFTISTILVSPRPFSPEQIAAFERTVALMHGTVRHVPGGPAASPTDVTRDAITLPDATLATLLANHPYDIEAVRDDKPLFWHFIRFGDLLRGRNRQRIAFDPEDGRGEKALLVMLAVSTMFAFTFLLAPLVFAGREWRRLPMKGRALVYFAALGFAFMCYEIVLIQKWTLFLGYPTYALTVTLAALLVSAGLGSLATERWGQRRDAMLPALLGALVVFTFFHGFGLGPLAGRLFAQPLGVRIAAAVLTMAPLGFCLGTFMPLGLMTVARLESAADGSAGGAADGHYVAWAWAVNGFFSVIGSLLATMASMTWGFRAVLVGALVVYLVAATVLRSMRLQQS